MCALTRRSAAEPGLSAREIHILLTALANVTFVAWYNEAHETGCAGFRRVDGGGAAVRDSNALSDRAGQPAALAVDHRVAAQRMVELGVVYRSSVGVRRLGRANPSPARHHRGSPPGGAADRQCLRGVRRRSEGSARSLYHAPYRVDRRHRRGADVLDLQSAGLRDAGRVLSRLARIPARDPARAGAARRSGWPAPAGFPP